MKPDNSDVDKLQKRLDKATNELKKLSENSQKSSKTSVDAAAVFKGGGGKLGTWLDVASVCGAVFLVSFVKYL